ncbi:hypothetical protein LSG16_12530 [Lactococcus cremoris]|uniref:hypothetical protein n=1 Tax=Lactococcus lactis subsp. cremoris TaxID=1359 RepID=UPI001E47A23A|nr:hypothetical protein [Lactococcus cremoris]MCD6633651.1 hypothetical protein [Lactococcus cremoris]
MNLQEMMGKSLNLKQLYVLITKNKNYIKALDAQGKVEAEVMLRHPFVPDDSYKALAFEGDISRFYINIDSQLIKTQIIKNLQELEDEARKLEGELGIKVE